MRNMPAVNPLCTSFASALRRIARGPVARCAVVALALLLASANAIAAAMPLPAASAQTAPHAHCVDRAGSSRIVAHAGHDAAGGCCAGASCLCAQACDTVGVRAVSAPRARGERRFTAEPPSAYSAIEARLLRPPIG